MLTKTVLITGAKEGLGYHIALRLAYKRYKIILADNQDLTLTKEKIKERTCNENIHIKYIDLSSLASVKYFAKDFLEKEKKLHVLINNAGVFGHGIGRTRDCLNYTMQVNHFSRFLLTCLLKDILKKSEIRKLFPIKFIPSTLTYYNSKLCNMIVSKGFANKLKDYDVTSNCFHPGMMNSNFLLKNQFENSVRPFAKKILNKVTNSIDDGAKLAIHLTTSETLSKTTGQYFDNYQIHEQPLLLNDQNFCQKIWTASEQYLNMTLEEKLP